jgi:hypothetical protein
MKKCEDIDVAGYYNSLHVIRESNKIYFFKTYAYFRI